MFLSGATIDDNETSFSRNYISLEISGRELEDLSFVDLPGLIASVGQHGRVDDIELVRGLVVSYIERESCVILLTVACESSYQACYGCVENTALTDDSPQPILKTKEHTTSRNDMIRKAGALWVSHLGYASSPPIHPLCRGPHQTGPHPSRRGGILGSTNSQRARTIGQQLVLRQATKFV